MGDANSAAATPLSTPDGRPTTSELRAALSELATGPRVAPLARGAASSEP